MDVDRVESQLHIETHIDGSSGALIAVNPYHGTRPNATVFLQVLAAERSLTGSRKGFLGRNGSWQLPVGLLADQLDNQVGTGFDPFGAIQTRVTVDPGQKISVRFLLGIGEDLSKALLLVKKYQS
jgi:cellobiose phosphorylase